MAQVGSYLMARGWMDNPVFGGAREPYCRRAAWCWMIEAASYQDREIGIGSRSVKLTRGQLSHSYRFLSEAWGWSLARVQRFIDRLSSDGMVSVSPISGQIVVTLCNYERYQNFDRIGDTRPIQDRYRTDTNKNEGNEGNKLDSSNDESNASSSGTVVRRSKAMDDPEFRAFYQAFPRRVDPGRAADAYRAARKSASAADLIDGALRYAAECAGKDQRYVKHPATWLNAKSWLNEAPEAPPSGGDRAWL